MKNFGKKFQEKLTMNFQKLELFLGGWTPIAITTESEKIKLAPNDEIDLASCSGNCWASDNAAKQ